MPNNSVALFGRRVVQREHYLLPNGSAIAVTWTSPLRIPAQAALLLGEGRLGDAARFFEQQHLEVDEAEPGRVGDVMVVAALELGEDVAQGFGELTFRVGPHRKVLPQSLTESLNRIGRAGAEDFRVRFDLQKLRE